MQRTKNNDFFRFVKKNLAIIIILACAIGATLIAVVVKSSKVNNIPDDVIVDAGGNNGDTVLTPPEDKPVDTTPEEEQTAPKPKPYVLPIANFVIGMDYSRDSEYVLVFKKTFNEYSVHNGVDFLADEGCEVKAINDGTVTKVVNDFGMGWTVEITHSDGYVSRYSSLGEDLAVVEGEEVECGQRIGSVANTATYENLEGSHLHFELMCNDEYVNPRQLLAI